MALIVETGSGVSGADSYIDTTDAQAFIDDRGLTITITDGLLLRAMDQLETLDFQGLRVSSSQSLSFPRSGVCLSDNRVLASNEIPTELKSAQVWLAHYINAGFDPSSAPEQAIKREKVDVLETEYQDYSNANQTVMGLPNVANLLKHLVVSSGYIDRA